MTEQKVAAVLGVGPGLGAAIARRFAKEDFAVALMARSADKLEPIKAQIVDAGGIATSVPTDATDPASVKAAFERIADTLGAPEVLVYNAGAFVQGGVLEVEPDALLTSLAANCAGGFFAAQAVAGAMLEAGQGTILFTGATASLRGAAGFGAFAAGKFGLRAVAQSLARELGPKGIHVAHVIVDGLIDTPMVRGWMPDRAAETMLESDAMADVYWQLHSQPRRVWTHELDVRPSTESF